MITTTSKLVWLAKKINEASKEYNTSHVNAAVRFFHLYRESFSPIEIFKYGLLDPAVSNVTLSRFLPSERSWRYFEPINRCTGLARIDDKLLFDQVCQSEGLPVAPLLGAYPDFMIEKSGPGDRIYPESAQVWRNTLHENLPDEFIVKPRCGVRGYGVRVIKRENGCFSDHDDTKQSLDELTSYLDSISAMKELQEEFPLIGVGVRGAVIQQVLTGHSVLSKLSGTNVVHTVRICTYVDSDGQVSPLFAFLKIVGRGNVIDNFSGGALGNMIGQIHLESGTLEYVFACRPDTNLGYRLACHPDSGQPFAGFQVPLWPEALDLAYRAARVFLPSRALGWDVAITPDGPVLLEGNQNWEPVVPFHTRPWLM